MGHETITFFSKKPKYEDALKDLKKKQEQDREENGSNGDWVQVCLQDVVIKELPMKDLKNIHNWAYDHVDNYDFFAIQVNEPSGWFFTADIHI